MNNTFQRKGSTSNASVGISFENLTADFFSKKGLALVSPFPLEIGLHKKKKHNFDFGDISKKVIIECKSHCWTETDNIPSAKITTWDQAMFYFLLAPNEYRKIFFVQRDYSERRKETLADYYLRTKFHLIPQDVEIWEFDINQKIANCLKK